MNDRYQRGRAVMDEVYGPGFSAALDGQSGPFLKETVEHLFGEVWNRPDLSTRDRRLLVLGATAAFGRADLVQVQARGALASGDCTPDELHESVLQLAFYVGWGNATSVQEGIARAVAETTTAAEPNQD
ncbi:carboxymuconolactone decarboxylase family protein [Saccharopolyspora sp. SCSIO 74807]|uniref:carboxymuconolactone decarboxylase family protein n=1 Tax=Saccharopolyspora sp. SCSIO 74807 TaxID=3118084 RepID=UPI0030D0530E